MLDTDQVTGHQITHDELLLRRAEKFRLCDEYRHDQTRQRRFELAFESRDLAESEATIEGEGVVMDSFALVAGHGAALYGRRTFSLASPADIATVALDLAYWAEVLRRAGRHGLLPVLHAMAHGLTADKIGLSERTFRRRMKKIENILSADPDKFRLGL